MTILKRQAPAIFSAVDIFSDIEPPLAIMSSVIGLAENLRIEIAVPILHRVHGAIGFTIEYPLNRYTRRLMGWRSEFGNDAFWARTLGERTAKLGGSGLWREIVVRGDRKVAAA